MSALARPTRLGAGLLALAVTGLPMYPRAATVDATAGSVTGQAMSGFWNMAPPPRRPGAAGGPPGGGGGPPPPRPPSSAQLADRLQPWALEQVKRRENALAAGEELPTNANQCLPWAIPGNGIVVTRDKVVFMYQLDHQAHIVYLNKQHPAGLAPSYFGHSVGRWEGDVLVIDTIGFNDTTLIQEVVPHTKALHVVERLQLKAGELEAQSTLEDAGAFKSPLVFTEHYVRSNPYQEYVCAENNHEASASEHP
jgi:hypothetical protein